MGNQSSRLDHSTSTSSSTVITEDDYLADNMRQWHNKDNKRQYPLPTINDSNNRIKPRKQSSPAAVYTKKQSSFRFFNRHHHNTRNNSINTLSINNTSPSIPTNNSNISFNNTPITNTSQPNFVHPLAPPSIIHSVDQLQLYPFDDEQSILTSSNRNSLNNAQILLLNHQQKHQEQQQLYQIQGKRKYHKIEGSNYLLPCDDEEIDRLHLQHFMVRFAIQGNYLAPVSDVLRKGGRVLDVACGPGSWSMEIAGEYPKSKIIGIDMTPIYPKEIKPTNCAFYQCNLLDPPLPFEDNTFDYVFMRFMAQGVEKDKWNDILKELIRVLKPNGWIEWVETDHEIHRAGPNTHEFNQKLLDLMHQNNQDPHIGQILNEKLAETGELININSMFISCPGGQWAGKLGQVTMQSWKAYYQALRPLLAQAWGLSPHDYNEKLKLCWREADEYKTFENVHFAYAQKKNN